MQTRVCRLYSKKDIRIETQSVDQPAPGEVRIATVAGGICGSDLHYYHDGGFGPIRVREPIILGHEVAGTVESKGEGVTSLCVGDRVAINPSQPCRDCSYCDEGLYQHCMNMRFLGSAMRMPHEQGAFRDLIVVKAIQCEPAKADTSYAELACAEPLAVCLHAGNRAGDLAGRRILVTGAGPIGSLCTAVARHAGASEIVVTDLFDRTLESAALMGATQTINISSESQALDRYYAGKGYFDVVFECSAALPALQTAISAMRPQGVLVQLGITGDLPIPVNLLVGKEINMIGSHRFHGEFAKAVKLIDTKAINVRPIITDCVPVAQAVEAFELASDRSRAVKVHLDFSG